MWCPTGRSELDKAIAEGKSIVDGFVQERTFRPHPRSRSMIFLSVNVVLLAAICTYVLYRRSHRAREGD